mmetsp:Transcript_14816/g.24120  ORF Transcript_14816/g.24120 Transcript_14816/m.24120 type:complete len:517 (+) Transcript_14816:1064-2614(+)
MTLHLAQTGDMRIVHVYIDFKSSGSYLLCMGPLFTLERDYRVNIRILPFETTIGDLDPRCGDSDGHKFKHKLMNFERYAKLQELPIGDVTGTCQTLLLGLVWVNRTKPECALRYCQLAFNVFHDRTVENESVDVLKRILNDVGCPLTQNGALDDMVKSRMQDDQYLRKNLSPYSERDLFGVPCMVTGNGVMCYQVHELSMVRYQLHCAGLKRRLGVCPDITCAWRIGAPLILPQAIGMPNTLASLPRYRQNSANPEHCNTARKVIDVYMDVKSPHAYLSIEMIMALEEDFDVHINFLPFALDIVAIYGDATASVSKRHPESNLPPPISFQTNVERAGLINPRKQRTAAQKNIVKWTYADIRRFATLRGITVYGTEKVWDSALILKAMLYCKSLGRDILDRFHEVAYEKLWRRKLNIEDFAQVKAVVTTAGGDPSDFQAYCRNRGAGELSRIVHDAQTLKGVFGVPSLVLDGEVFWGKEHLSLIRLRLHEQGLYIGESATPVIDVPYLWRPSSTSKI